MTTTMKIITLVVIPILVLAIGLGIFLAVSNGDSGDDPVETLQPVEDTTNPNESDTDNTTPSIPDIEPDKPGSEDHKQETPGDITVDVNQGEETEDSKDDPAIKGEVSIFPGVKGDDE